MSEKKELLRKWVAEKLESRNEKIKETGDEKSVLFNYLVALSGAVQALEVVGVEEDAITVINTALDIISEDLEAVKERELAEQKQKEREKRLQELLG